MKNEKYTLTGEEKQFIKETFELIKHEQWDALFSNFDESGSYFPNIYGFLCEYTGKKILHYMTWIPQMMFAGNNILEEVEIPDNISVIGPCAFKQCHNLHNVCIPKSVGLIQRCAFDGCDKLKELNYSGTQQQWNNNVAYGKGCFDGSSIEKIVCKDGSIEI